MAAWGSLFVKPGYQRKGIGERLLRWGFEKLELDKEEIWLTTQMPGREFYRRFGWEDIDAVDMDLSTYLGKYKGFGVHRTVFMMRKPGNLVKSEVKSWNLPEYLLDSIERLNPDGEFVQEDVVRLARRNTVP